MGQHTLYSDIWSLGVIAWQVICQRFPYGIETFVGSEDSEKRERIVSCQKTGEDPGQFPEDVPQGLAEGIKKCWNRDPSRRPSAVEVATLIQDHWLNLVPEKNKGVTKTRPPALDDLNSRVEQATKAFGSEHSAADLECAISRASSLVSECRQSSDNKKKKGGGGGIYKVRLEKISLDEVKALVRAEKPGCAYRVGACIWWEMLDEMALRFVEGTRPIEYTATTQDGQRAELALSFLREAERGRCMDGRFEIHLAYSLLSGLYKNGGEKSGSKKASGKVTNRPSK